VGRGVDVGNTGVGEGVRRLFRARSARSSSSEEGVALGVLMFDWHPISPNATMESKQNRYNMIFSPPDGAF
jgi:hypothetical protein